MRASDTRAKQRRSVALRCTLATQGGAAERRIQREGAPRRSPPERAQAAERSEVDEHAIWRRPQARRRSRAPASGGTLPILFAALVVLGCGDDFEASADGSGGADGGGAGGSSGESGGSGGGQGGTSGVGGSTKPDRGKRSSKQLAYRDDEVNSWARQVACSQDAADCARFTPPWNRRQPGGEGRR
jgi:hypothetical protein